MSDYDFPTIGSLSRSSPCGCRVGLLSDVEDIPANVRMHMGSIPNPWIVIHCDDHRRLQRGPELVRCSVCNLNKPPRGRSVPMEAANGMCHHECSGYDLDPRPSSLWPNELGLVGGLL